jgi:hypothetical protein
MNNIEVHLAIGGLLAIADRYPDIVREETVKRMKVAVARLEKDVVELTPAGVGGAAGLRGSIHGDVDAWGESVRGTVGTAVKYAEVVEVGRKAGSFPPVAPIALWAQRKLGVGADEAESVGFLIARKIFRSGTEGAHMFEQAWKQNETWVMDQMQHVLADVVGRVAAL